VFDQIRRGSRMGPSLNRPLVALSLRLVTGRRRRGPPAAGESPGGLVITSATGSGVTAMVTALGSGHCRSQSLALALGRRSPLFEMNDAFPRRRWPGGVCVSSASGVGSSFFQVLAVAYARGLIRPLQN